MKKLPNVLVLILAAVLLFCCPASTFSSDAVGTGGNGDGVGENSGQPLELTYSSVQNGQTNVSVDAAIDLVFSNNVVHFSIAENNKNCFVLQDETGMPTSIAVVMGDDQVDPSIRRNIGIVPESSLEQGVKYTLIISKSFS